MRKYLILIITLCCTSLLGQTVVVQNTAQAFKVLEKAVKLVPSQADSANALYQIAEGYFLENDSLDHFFLNGKSLFRQLYSKDYSLIAANWLESILKQAQEGGLTTSFEVYYELARAHYFGKRFSSCLAEIQASKIIEEQDTLLIASMLNLAGAANRQMGKSKEAIVAYQKALGLRRKILGENHNLVASLYNNLGIAYRNLDLVTKAVYYYDKAKDIRSNILGDRDPEMVKLYNNLANLFTDIGRTDQAISYLSKALQIAEENSTGSKEELGNLYLNLGTAYKQNVAFDEAESFYNRALVTFESSNSLANLAFTYNNLGTTYRQKGQALLAIENHQKALETHLAIAEVDKVGLADVHTNLSHDYLSIDDFEKSLANLTLAQTIYNQEEASEDIANTYNNIGDVYFRMQKLELAKLFQDSALHIQAELFDQKHPAIAYTCNKLCEIALAQNDHQLALAYIQKALIANHQTFGDTDPAVSPSSNGYLRYDYFFEALLLKADIFRQSFSKDREKLQLAQQQYHIADSILSNLRNELTSKADKINLAQKVQQLSKVAIATAWQLAAISDQKAYLDEAFYFAEKSKANVLLQSISANNAKQFAGIPDSLLALEEELQSDINYYSLQLLDRPDSTKIPLFQAELFEARQMHKKLISRFEEDFPIYYELKYASQIPRVNAVQFGLSEKTAMVSYFTGDSVLYAFYLSKNDYQVFSTSLNALAFTKNINAFTKGAKSTSQSLGRVFVSTGQALYQQVFPFPIPESIKQLVIIPDGQLTKIPFEALLTTEVNTKAAIDFSTLPYLINDFDISYTPSASLYYQSQTNTQPNTYSNNAELVAFAPVFSNEEPLSPSTQRFLENSGDQERAFTKDGTYISPLPGTAIELEAISLVFAYNNLSTTNFTYQQATEAQIKSKLVQECRYLHIATHGFINEDYPDLSGLLFATDTSSLENAILAAGEVYGLQLKANLVVLSACETGKGKITSGEGVLGLSRAFLYAGADNLIVSLWKVDDRATAELMTAFYTTHLKRSVDRLPFKEALRQAKLQLIQSKEFSQPYYWSAFVLIGE